MASDNMEWKNSCRFCAHIFTAGAKRISLFNPKSQKKINECVPIKVLPTDPFPSWMCHPCEIKLSSFYSFRQMCSRNNKSFHEVYNAQMKQADVNIPEEFSLPMSENTSEPSPMMENPCDSLSLNQDLNPLDEGKSVFVDCSNIKLGLAELCPSDVDFIKTEPVDILNFPDMETVLEDAALPDIQVEEDAALQHVPDEDDAAISRAVNPDALQTSEVPLECGICRAVLQDVAAQELHLLVHKHFATLTCTFCPDTFQARKKQWNHELYHLSNTNEIRCKFCNMSFANVRDVKAHFRSHLGIIAVEAIKPPGLRPNLFDCRYCSRSYSRPKKLVKHEKRCMAPQTGLYDCDICEARFLDRSERLTHDVMLHRDRPVEPKEPESLKRTRKSRSEAKDEMFNCFERMKRRKMD